MGSLIGGGCRFIMTISGGGGYAEVPANLSSKTCQNVDLLNQCKQPNEGMVSDMSDVQNPHKLSLNRKSIVVIESMDKVPVYLWDNR